MGISGSVIHGSVARFHRLICLFPLLLALFPATAHAQAQTSPDTRSGGLIFGPKLLYYPLECQDSHGCRIDCFQNGVNVASHTGISHQDEVRLVVNAGISDEIIPRWIEIRPFNSGESRSLILTRDTFCDLKAFIIRPSHQP